MSRWSKSDKNAWNDSEVMSELEKNIVRSMKEMIEKIDMKKEAQAANQVSQKVQQITKDVDTASKSMNSFLEKAKSLAEDDELMNDEEDDKLMNDEEDDDLEDDNLEDDDLEDDADDQEAAREELLRELREMEITASYNHDYKLSYKIERAIDSILYEEE